MKGIMFLCFILLGLICTVRSYDLYISPSGDDSNDGTSATSPLRSIPSAQAKARVIIANGIPSEGITINFAPGNYYLNSTVSLNKQDSGLQNARVVWKGSREGASSIVGGVAIPAASFVPVTDTSILSQLNSSAASKIVQVDLKALGITDLGNITEKGFTFFSAAPLEIFIDSKPMTIAQFPNTGSYLRIRNGSEDTMSFLYDAIYDSKAALWAKETDPRAFGYWGLDWADYFEPITTIDTKTRNITLSRIGNYGLDNNQRYYLFNMLCEIDTPGEYYIDRQNGILYLYPPASFSSSSEILVSTINNLFSISSVSYVTFENLLIQVARLRAFEVVTSTGLTVKNVEIRNIGSLCGSFSRVTDLLIQSSYIHDCGEGGLSVNGGNRADLTPSGIEIINNHFAYSNRWGRTYKPSLRLDGVAIHVAHNYLHNTPHSVIIHGGNDHILEYNRIHDVCTDTGDSGAIYSGRTFTNRGNIIRKNFLYHISGPGIGGTSGVYLDDQYSSAEVSSNIFYDMITGVLIGGGRDNNITNNMFINTTSRGIYMDSRGLCNTCGPCNNGVTLNATLYAVPITTPPWSTRYPALADLRNKNFNYPEGNVIHRNYFYINKTRSIQYCPANVSSYVDSNLNANSTWNSSDFVDPQNLNFELSPSNPAFNSGFQAIDFKNIGLLDEPVGVVIDSNPDVTDTISDDQDNASSALSYGLICIFAVVSSFFL